MMNCFYEVSTPLQIVLLILSQVAIVTLLGSVLLLWRRYGEPMRFETGAATVLMLINVTLYIVIQLDSRLTGADHGLRLNIPYAVLLAFTLFSLVYAVCDVLKVSRGKEVVNNNSVKEAFDNLPTGVCFFNEAGLPVLCNFAMHRFSFAFCGRDVQFITDLEECLSDDFVPIKGTSRDGKAFILPDGKVWQLECRTVTQGDDNQYTQFIASDITELYKTRVELTDENAQLRKAQADLKRLSANVVAATREEEILNTKMRVHDEMGRCLVAAQKYLREGGVQAVDESVVLSWQRAVSMLRYNNESEREDILLQIRTTCQSINLEFIQSGEPPEDENIAYVLSCAVRECVTNAARYAQATELYADFTEDDVTATVTVYNNGKIPDGEITEGGGLSTLRRRVERAGGTMIVQSLPQFRLTVTVPKGKEGV